MDDRFRRSSARRKACDRCVEAKRRCDNQGPCSRCMRRGARCSLETSTSTVHAVVSQPHASLFEGTGADDILELDWPSPVAMATSTATTNERGVNWPIDEWRLYQLKPPTHVQLPFTYLNTMVQRLQSCTKLMAEDAETPFIKMLPAQYSSVNSIFDDAVLACTAYTNRNKRNRVSLNRSLGRSYLKLVGRLKSLSGSEEHLMTLQAVILFEIMFLLGEEHDLRQVALKCTMTVTGAIQTLNQWLIAKLSASTIRTIDSETETEEEHCRWITLESGRRTILTYWFLQAAYRHVRDGYCELVPLLVTLPLTVDGELWTAADAKAWSKLVQQRSTSTTVLPYVEATDYWMNMDYNYMDDFQIMLFETCRTIPARSVVED